MPPTSSRPCRSQQQVAENDEESDALPITHEQELALARRGKQKAALDDDSDDVVAPSSTNRRPRVIIPNKDSDEDEQEPVTSPLKRRRLVPRESEESDTFVLSPSKRARRSTPIAPHNDEDDDDSDSDLPSLMGISKAKGKGPFTPSRLTRQQKAPRHRTEKEKTMELLKRKRAGEKITALTDSEVSDAEDGKGGVYDTDSDLQALSEFEDEEESPEILKQKTVKPKRRAATGEDEYDSEFVVDDEEGMLGMFYNIVISKTCTNSVGVPDIGLHDIPLEFTHAAHKPLKEHFKDAVCPYGKVILCVANQYRLSG